MKHLQIKVEGRVQGVFYRARAVNEADTLGLKGWVKNLPDGSVLISAEGDEKALAEMVSWCWQGSSFAKVKNVITEEKDPEGFTSFEVEH